MWRFKSAAHDGSADARPALDCFRTAGCCGTDGMSSNHRPELLRKYGVSPLESVQTFRALFHSIGSAKMQIFIIRGERHSWKSGLKT